MIAKSGYTGENTSPSSSKGGEQAVRKIIVRKQLPLLWRGLGGGASGLLRSARNDGRALIYNLVNPKNLTKILVQDKGEPLDIRYLRIRKTLNQFSQKGIFVENKFVKNIILSNCIS